MLGRGFVELISRVRFSSPPSRLVLVYDEGGHEALATTVLRDIEHVVYPVRDPVFYCSLRMLSSLIRHLLWLITHGIRNRKVVKLSYYWAFLSVANCKVAITCIDNAAFFWNISSLCDGVEFFVVQNGLRNRQFAQERRWSIPIPHFFAHGMYTKRLYEEFGLAQKVHVVGSLKAGFYKKELSTNEFESYDICFVSAYRPGNDLPDHTRAREVLTEYFKNYLLERKNLKVCVACRSADDGELAYFRQWFPDGMVDIVPNRLQEFTTYGLMDVSTVVVGVNSSAQYESFGWGRKSLFTDYSEGGDLQLDLPEFCVARHGGYDSFSEKLDALLCMGQSEFEEKTEQSRREMCLWNPAEPAHEILGKMIQDALLK